MSNFYLQFVRVDRQSGGWANYPTQEPNMGTTTITTTSTELHPNRMIGVDQVACNVSLKNIAECSMHLNQPAGTSKMAIFDVAAESSMDSERELLSFKHTEDSSLPSCGSHMANSVLSTEGTKLSVSPCGSMLDSGLPSEGLPNVYSLGDNVLNNERPLSPSDFLQQNPAPSSSQMQDIEVSPIVNDLIDQVLKESNPMNGTPQLDIDLDLDLFNDPDINQDVLNDIVQECGIWDEINNGNHVQCSKKDMATIKMEEEIQAQCKRKMPKSEVKKESQVHYTGELSTLSVPTTMVQPTRNQEDFVGPVRTRQTRRSSRNLVRYKIKYLDDESSAAEIAVNTEFKNLVGSTSSSTQSSDQDDVRELTGEEKYKRNREQNNAASKRCREKRKEKLENMKLELIELEKKNEGLKDKVKRLTSLRDDFKKFVYGVLFDRMA
ncbi:uncharacterized protein LOC123498544 isoform X2 [Portunus trituberculatus]|uniref:uncharacterized protein LOC123498544 isoform X2 n=1 Tax=Portunus trituberculatus TaxID=210409 RepID=UPI001E1CD201|nr:uncharacterized protein LOC123498544 isoform X2 [Portunus trituberculatus]